MQALGVLAAFDDAMEGRRRHEQDDAGGDQAEARQMRHLRGARQFFESVHQDRRELKAEQRLGAGEHHPRFGQNLLDPG